MAAHQAPPSLGFSRQEHWSGLPFPSPMHESEKWKWSRSVVSDSVQPHGLQPTRLLRPWDFPGKRVLEWGAIAFSPALCEHPSNNDAWPLRQWDFLHAHPQLWLQSGSSQPRLFLHGHPQSSPWSDVWSLSFSTQPHPAPVGVCLRRGGRAGRRHYLPVQRPLCSGCCILLWGSEAPIHPGRPPRQWGGFPEWGTFPLSQPPPGAQVPSWSLSHFHFSYLLTWRFYCSFGSLRSSSSIQ